MNGTYRFEEYRGRVYLFVSSDSLHHCAAEFLQGDVDFDVYLKDTFINRIRARLGCV